MKKVIVILMTMLFTLSVFADEHPTVVEQSVDSTTRIIDVDTAIAPNISTHAQDVCSLPVSGAIQSSIIGISGGKTFTDENCERLKLAKILFDIGLKTSAVSLLCQDDRVFEAMLHAGTLCPVYGLTGTEALKYYYDNMEKYDDFEKEILELYNVKYPDSVVSDKVTGSHHHNK